MQPLQVSFFEHLVNRRNPRVDMTQTEVRATEVATDLIGPVTDTDGRRTRATAAEAQRRQNHPAIHKRRQYFAYERMTDRSQRLLISLHDGYIIDLPKLPAPFQNLKEALHVFPVFRLKHIQARLEPFLANGQHLRIKSDG
jgi:hypothetical protein